MKNRPLDATFKCILYLHDVVVVVMFVTMATSALVANLRGTFDVDLSEAIKDRD